MKKMITLMVIIMAIISVFATGCGSKDKDTGEDERIPVVAICVGAHANSKKLNLNSAQITEAVNYVAEKGGNISIISMDGRPEVLLEGEAGSFAVPEQYANANPAKLLLDARNKGKAVLSAITEITADDPEIDILDGLHLAERALSEFGAEYSKTIIVVDTGLSTSGEIDFNNNLILGEPWVIAKALAERNALPNLTGIHVIWQQMGDVDYPQDPLTHGQVQKLKDIWQAIVETAGGSIEYSDANAAPGIVNDSLPIVSVVSMPGEMPIQFMDAQMPQVSFDTPQFLSEEQCRFIGDSDEYVDPAQVYETLTPVASYMMANPEFTMLLVGTTAGDEDSEYSYDLSARRAAAVKDTLISMGVPEGNILTIGMGSSDPWHIYGAGTEGELASQNRKVVLVNADSEVAADLLIEW